MISVNWGAWFVSDESAQLRSMGLVPMAPEKALAWLSQVISATRADVMIADMDWKTVKALYESRRVRPMLSQLGAAVATANSDEVGTGRRSPAAGETGLGGRSIAEVVLAEAARILGFRGGDNPPIDVPLTDLGLDSLMAVDLRNRLQTAIGRELPSTIVFDYPTVAKLTAMMETMAWSACNPSQNESAEQDEVLI
jgi:acyl carrier protein